MFVKQLHSVSTQRISLFTQRQFSVNHLSLERVKTFGDLLLVCGSPAHCLSCHRAQDCFTPWAGELGSCH